MTLEPEQLKWPNSNRSRETEAINLLRAQKTLNSTLVVNWLVSFSTCAVQNIDKYFYLFKKIRFAFLLEFLSNIRSKAINKGTRSIIFIQCKNKLFAPITLVTVRSRGMVHENSALIFIHCSEKNELWPFTNQTVAEEKQ